MELKVDNRPSRIFETITLEKSSEVGVALEAVSRARIRRLGKAAVNECLLICRLANFTQTITNKKFRLLGMLQKEFFDALETSNETNQPARLKVWRDGEADILADAIRCYGYQNGEELLFTEPIFPAAANMLASRLNCQLVSAQVENTNVYAFPAAPAQTSEAS